LDYNLELRDFAQGIWMAFECTSLAEAGGEVEIWGYPDRGDAEIIHKVTAIGAGAQTSDDGLYWADTMAVSTTEYQTVDAMTLTDHKAFVKLDTGGYKNIVAICHTKTAAVSGINIWARVW
jgi:hypothetical protein